MSSPADSTPTAVTIRVNWREHTVACAELSYRQIVGLAGHKQLPGMIWTTVVHYRHSSSLKDRIVGPGESAPVEVGMSIECVDTSHA